jgi:hypothetical protein
MDIKVAPSNKLLLSFFLYAQPGVEEKLDQTLFILTAQKHHPIEVFIVVDGLTKDIDDEQLKLVLKRWSGYFSRLVLMPPLESSDAFWSIDKLLPYAQGHYLSFLAAGQKIYPHLYSSLIEGLQKSPDNVWAYSDVVMVHHNPFNQVNRRWTPFLQESYAQADHLLMHYIPIQSVVVDRLRAAKLQKCHLPFRSQDHHAILLHLAEESAPLHLAIIGAEELSSYAVNQDNSHIVNEIADRYTLNHSYDSSSIKNQEELVKFKKRSPFLNANFYSQLQKFELSHNPDSYYFRRKLKRYYESLSWRITKPLRNIVKIAQGLPIDQNLIPECEVEASDQIMRIEKSSSWRLTRILRADEDLNSEIKKSQ